MKRGLFIQLFLPIAVFAYCLYSYIDQQNLLTQLRISIPEATKEIRMIREENMRLKYEIDLFESPEHLLQLSRNCEFSHLKHPLMKEILTVQEGDALELASQEKEEKTLSVKPKLTLAKQ
jgi:hypothetical protein